MARQNDREKTVKCDLLKLTPAHEGKIGRIRRVIIARAVMDTDRTRLHMTQKQGTQNFKLRWRSCKHLCITGAALVLSCNKGFWV